MDSLLNRGLYLVGFILASFGGSFFVRWVLGPFRSGMEDSAGLDRAGQLIGVFERAIVVLLVFQGAYSALGLIFAAKSIARFNRLKKREAAEYYLVGTLASVTFALVVGMAVDFAAGYLQAF